MTFSRRSLSLLFGGLWLMGLACGGGASVDPVTHLEPLCSAGKDGVGTADLVTLDVPSASMPPGPKVRLGEELTFDGLPVTVDGLRDALQGSIDMAALMGESTLDVVLLVEANTPLLRVQDVGRALREGGVSTISLAVATSEPWPKVDYPDPAFAEQFKVTLANASPDMRQMHAAREIQSLIVACPGAQRAFEAVAHASPDMKCILMAHGLSEALPSCPLTDGDAVLTAFQVLAEPSSATRPGLLKPTLDPAGTAVPVPADATWAAIAPLLKTQSGGVWPVVEGS